MRKAIPLILAATLLIAAPANAQDNAAAANDIGGRRTRRGRPARRQCGGRRPGRQRHDRRSARGAGRDRYRADRHRPMPTPVADDDGDDGRFPWGLLGLLGLAGLIPRKPAPRRHDGAI